jgi:hypothetical protein
MSTNPNRFWVIGGQFRDMTFTTIREPALSGPFGTHRDAMDEWRKLSALSSASALTRYMITAEG